PYGSQSVPAVPAVRLRRTPAPPTPARAPPSPGPAPSTPWRHPASAPSRARASPTSPERPRPATARHPEPPPRSSRIRALGPLAPAPGLRANPYDLDRLGVQTGGRVRVRARQSLVMEVLADTDVPRGVAVVDLDLAEEGAEDLIDSSRTVTDVRLETL